MTAVTVDVEPDADLMGTCDGCGRHRPIVAGILLLETEDQAAEDLGFCSTACLVTFVSRRWMEA